MKTLFFLSLISLVACGGGSSNDYSDNSCYFRSSNPRIINGDECDIQRSPVVQISIAPDNDFADVCSGTLITANAVLTAAHCLVFDTSSVTVKVGNEVVTSKNVFIHPQYRVDTSKNLTFNDVGIVILSKPVNSVTVPLIVSRNTEVGQYLNIYGYGLDENKRSNTLKTGKMNISEITSTHLNAKYTGNNQNVCDGDSGGPAIQLLDGDKLNDTYGIVGIVSTGENNTCGVNDTAHFTRINQQQIIDFILNYVPSVGLI